MPLRICIHTKTDGRQCGSPAMRGELRCYFHYRQQKPIKHIAHLGDLSTQKGRARALSDVYRALWHRRIDAETAGKLLYAIQSSM